jgi:hypothetical protein
VQVELSINRNICSTASLTVSPKLVSETRQTPVIIRKDWGTRSREQVWRTILNETLDDVAENRRVVIEVGMHRAKQALEAADADFVVHGLEPSPESFATIGGAICGKWNCKKKQK